MAENGDSRGLFVWHNEHLLEEGTDYTWIGETKLPRLHEELLTTGFLEIGDLLKVGTYWDHHETWIYTGRRWIAHGVGLIAAIGGIEGVVEVVANSEIHEPEFSVRGYIGPRNQLLVLVVIVDETIDSVAQRALKTELETFCAYMFGPWGRTLVRPSGPVGDALESAWRLGV